MDKHALQLDEALLSNAFAWIRKCSEDGFDTMVSLIQKVRGAACGGAVGWQWVLQTLRQLLVFAVLSNMCAAARARTLGRWCVGLGGGGVGCLHHASAGGG
jgi:hypothetical protein